MKITAALVFAFLQATAVYAVSCPVLSSHPASEAQQAFLHADYEHAATLYTQTLAEHPNDPQLTAGLTDVLLSQQKPKDAEALLEKAISANPDSVILQTALGLVQYRNGTPWLANETLNRAMKLDLCYPRVHLLNMYLLRLNSMYKTAAKELQTAHSLDPADPEIRRYWLTTLPLQQRIAEAEAYLAAANGDDQESLKRMQLYLATLKRVAAEPHKACQIASSNISTDIHFAPILRDATHLRAYGLDVKLNDHTARLEIDTGASGLLISRSVAKQSGLESFAPTEVGGVGSAGGQAAYTAYVDSIKIGSLEFHDCAVTVLDSRSVVGVDGLIGMNVFSNLLVTLDYPMRKLTLMPLPPRPQEDANAKASLETSESQNTSDETTEKAGKGPQDRYIAPEMKDWTRVYRSGHELLLPAAINQTNLKLFILDTGAFTTSISPEAAREVTKLHSYENLTVRGVSGKVEKVYSADNVTFDFAHLRQKAEQAVSFDTSNISKHTGLEISGFIGITTLGQLTVKIDYRDALVKFEYDPNRGYRPAAP